MLVFRKTKKLDNWYFGLLVAMYQKQKDENMKWTGHKSLYYYKVLFVSVLPMVHEVSSQTENQGKQI